MSLNPCSVAMARTMPVEPIGTNVVINCFYGNNNNAWNPITQTVFVDIWMYKA